MLDRMREVDSDPRQEDDDNPFDEEDEEHEEQEDDADAEDCDDDETDDGGGAKRDLSSREGAPRECASADAVLRQRCRNGGSPGAMYQCPTCREKARCPVCSNNAPGGRLCRDCRADGACAGWFEGRREVAGGSAEEVRNLQRGPGVDTVAGAFVPPRRLKPKTRRVLLHLRADPSRSDAEIARLVGQSLGEECSRAYVGRIRKKIDRDDRVCDADRDAAEKLTTALKRDPRVRDAEQRHLVEAYARSKLPGLLPYMMRRRALVERAKGATAEGCAGYSAGCRCRTCRAKGQRDAEEFARIGDEAMTAVLAVHLAAEHFASVGWPSLAKVVHYGWWTPDDAWDLISEHTGEVVEQVAAEQIREVARQCAASRQRSAAPLVQPKEDQRLARM